MSESTLTLGYTDFQRIVGYFLGYGRDTSVWTSNQTSEVDDIIQSGVRKFYYPQVTESNQPHSWTFLKPKTTLTTIVDYDTGTISSSGTTVTLTGGTLPSWIATNGTLVVSNTNYTIASRTSDTEFELDSAPDTAFSGDSYTIEHDADYDLPDNFGVINGPIYYPSEQWYNPIKVVPYNLILRYRQKNYDSGVSEFVGIRPKTSDGSDGQRFVAMFWPRPSSAWELIYKYEILPDKLSTGNPYPYGGMAHGETILESIMAVAEQRGFNTKGVHTETFLKNLSASIGVDKGNIADHFGYNGDNSDLYNTTFDRHSARTNIVTVNGEIPF